MNAATFGYGKRLRITKAGPASYGMDGLLTVLWVMRVDSQEPTTVLSFAQTDLAKESVLASITTSSLEPGLAGVTPVRTSNISSVEPDLDTVTVEPVRQRPL